MKKPYGHAWYLPLKGIIVELPKSTSHVLMVNILKHEFGFAGLEFVFMGKFRMKELKLKRTQHLDNATIGKLTISDVKTDAIYTLENPKRETDKDNRIPAGTYNCKPYSGTKYQDVYIIENVPNRSAILIHWGNTEKDTLGCILIGNRIGKIGTEPAILESKKCYERFRSLIGKNEFKLVIED